MKILKGTTFIELTVTIGILALVIGLMGGVLISIVKAHQKARLYSEIKRSGDYALSIVEENIRGARSIECVETYGGVCVAITYKDKDYVTKKLGYSTGDVGLCPLGSNGYVYLMDYDPANPTDPTEADKITNDSSANGVNVSKMEFNIDASKGVTTVSVTMDIANSNCNTVVERSEKFETTVISRAD